MDIKQKKSIFPLVGIATLVVLLIISIISINFIYKTLDKLFIRTDYFNSEQRQSFDIDTYNELKNKIGD